MPWDWDKLQQGQKKGPARGAGPPPGIDDVLEKIKGAKGKLPGGFTLIIIAVILIFLGSSCFYTVGVDEVGIVQRFGKYVRTTPSGLGFKFPRGIEKVSKVKIRFVFKEEFGFFTSTAEYKGIAALKAGNDTSLFCLFDNQPIDFFLGKGMVSPFFADINQFGVIRGIF